MQNQQAASESQSESASQSGSPSPEASTIDLIPWLTGGLVFFAFLQAVFAAVAIFTTYRQLRAYVLVVEAGPGEHTIFRVLIPRGWWLSLSGEMVGGKKRLFVFGDYRYKDVFGFKQRGTFRYFALPIGGAMIDGPLAASDKGNDAT